MMPKRDWNTIPSSLSPAHLVVTTGTTQSSARRHVKKWKYGMKRPEKKASTLFKEISMTEKNMKDLFIVGMVFSLGAGLIDLIRLVIECL